MIDSGENNVKWEFSLEIGPTYVCVALTCFNQKQTPYTI